jgi:imidazolonepropionase-like amidohydrolase
MTQTDKQSPTRDLMASFALCAFLLAGSAVAQSAAPGVIHRAGTLVLDGSTVLRGDEALLAVRGGRVAFVGTGIPEAFRRSANTVDHGDDAWIVPGFVLAHTTFDDDANLAETVDAFTPDLRATDAFDPYTDELTRFTAAGTTSFALAPASRNTLPGLAGIVRYDIAASRGAVLEPTNYLKIALVDSALDQRRYPTSRMGAVEMLRRGFEQARTTADLQADPSLEVLARAAAGERPIAVHANTHAGITAALDLADELDLDIVLLGGRELDESFDRLPNEHLKGVVLGQLIWDSPDQVRTLSVELHRRGVPVAFVSDTPNGLRRTMAIAAREGLPRNVVRAGVTETPARLLGLEESVGNLRVGRHADFVVWSGDPVDLTATVRHVFVDATEFEPADRTAAEEMSR